MKTQNKKTRGVIALTALMLALCLIFTSCSSGGTTPGEDETLTPAGELAQSRLAQDNIPEGTKKVSVKKALAAYKDAANAVKSDSISFTKTRWEDYDNITSSDPTGITANLMTVISRNLVVNKFDDYESKAKISDTADEIKESFPVYGQDYGCGEVAEDDIASAVKVKDGDNTTYVVYFNDAVNSNPGDPGLGSVLSTVNREAILDSIKQYIAVINLETLKFDCTYSGCYMKFTVDKSGALVDLEQHLFCDIDASAELTLVLFNTNFINGKCTFESHTHYYGFGTSGVQTTTADAAE